MHLPFINFRSRKLALSLAIVCTSVASPSLLLAQADSGRIAGTVTDITGAAIPNASLTLVNPQTGLRLTGVTTGQGELNVPAIPAGTYTATITAPGFQTQTQQIVISVTQNLTVNFKLSLGDVTTNVEVRDSVALINTTDATLGEVIQGKQITELPLNGRNALTLALLTRA